MKQLFLILSVIILVMKLHGQTTWELLIPDYTNGTIPKSSFINDQEGWIIMVNQIWHTQDGGATWDKNFFGYNIFQFEFKSEIVGYAISQQDIYGFSKQVYKTIDAGLTWNVLDVPDSAYNSLYFLNTDTGFIGGNYEIYKTEDGGVSWSVIAFPDGVILDFHFINDSTGFAVNESNKVYKSTDRGFTWLSESLDNGPNLTNIFFLDQDTGFAYGYEFFDPASIIEKTTDGGSSWSLQYEGYFYSQTSDMIFRNNSEGFAITDNSPIEYVSSTDGGSSWDEVTLEGVTGNVYSFDGFNDIYAFGNHGEMYKLPADSSTWQSISQTYDGITAIRNHSFATPDTGWYIDQSRVYKTTDGGTTWDSISKIELNLIDAVNTNLLFAIQGNWFYDDTCSIYKSEDGGVTWNMVFSNDFDANKIQMIDQNVGYVLSYTGSVWKTNDGGLTWTETVINTGNYKGMQFLNENEGWALEGFYGDNAVYHTIDGGNTWQIIYQYTGTGWQFQDVYFLDSQHGWIVAYSVSPGEPDYFYTTDGGVNWLEYNSIGAKFNREIYFTDLQHGWLVNGFIYETFDGGNTWQQVFYSSYFDSESDYGVNEFEFVSDDAIYISGYSNTWLAKGSFCFMSGFTYSTSDFTVQFTSLSDGVTSWMWDFGDGSTSSEQNPSHTYSDWGTYNVCLIASGNCVDTSCLSIFVDYPLNTPSSNDPELIGCSVFPDPFSSSITIQFSLTENADLSIELFDLNGKSVKTILQNAQALGNHTISMDTKQLPVGFYLLRVASSGESHYFKVIKQ